MAIKVFFAPVSCGDLWQKSLQRRFSPAGALQHEDLFVILWHLGCYAWEEKNYDKAEALAIASQWHNLADELGKTKCARILVLAAEKPADLSYDPRAKFLFPDLLLKSVLQGRTGADNQTVKILWTTYSAFIDCDSSFLLWAPRDGEDSMLVRFCRSMAALPRKTGDLCMSPTDVGTLGAEPNSVNESKDNRISDKARWILHDDLFRFWQDPSGFRIEELHGAKPNGSSPDLGLTDDERMWARKVAALEHILSRVFVSPKLQLNVLLVENNVRGLEGWNVKSIERHQALWGDRTAAGCFGYFAKGRVTYYVVSTNFHLLRSETRQEIDADVYESDGTGEWSRRLQLAKIPWPKLDLVLQDIMLDSSGGALTGLHYAPYYLEACPQALVFLLTGMDVESLATSGDINWSCVDAIVSKRKLGSLWWNYHQAFTKTFGRMFWAAFHDAKERHRAPEFGDKESLRNLFGCLRRWRVEPAILGHGQGLPEMIDHAHRHITALWRLADDFVGTLIENTGRDDGPLTVQNRMLLALSIWLHDIGHRGNEFSDDPVVVRDTHGGISEYLLLRNPSAYGLQWLAEYHCHGKCMRLTEAIAPADNQRLRFRNCEHGCDGTVICPLRKVGILCRQHQSNAPLTANSLASMCEKGKFPTPYTRYQEGSVSSQADLEEWLDRSRPLAGWPGSDVRLLQDFIAGDQLAFMTLAGLLRMLDGLQIHRQRVGTPTSIGSFREFLRIRFAWCEKELERADDLLRNMRPGSKEYQAEVGRRDVLERYGRLLNVQYVHWWRQMAVHAVTIYWDWCAPSTTKEKAPINVGCGALDIQIELDDAGVRTLEELNSRLPIVERGEKRGMRFELREILESQLAGLSGKHTGADRRALIDAINLLAKDSRKERSAAGLWAAHVADDMIWSEHDSQKGTTHTGRPAYLNVLPDGVTFRVTICGISSEPFEAPLVLLEFPIKTA